MNAAISVSFTRMALGGVAALVFCSAVFANQANAGSAVELFTDHPSASAADLYGKHKPEPMVVRERPVRVNAQALSATADQAAAGAAMQRISLNLFPNVRHVFIPQKTEKSGDGKFTILSGSIAGGEPLFNDATIVFGDGVVIGNIRPGYGSMIYQIRVSPTGVQTVQEVDTNKFPEEAEPRPVYSPVSPHPSDLKASNPALADTTTVRVMVVYTPKARVAAGGTTAMKAKINLGIYETNLGYIHSGVIQRVQLAYSYEISYTEVAGGLAFDYALNAITSKTDGKMDGVHSVRNSVKADMVSLWISDPTYCGMAWLMTTRSLTFENKAFSVVDQSCATGYYSFAHEMGHNQGSHHDVYVAPGNGVYSYSHGYVDPTCKFRTIMAYANKCGSVTRVNYWSNPSVYYGGKITGASNANNKLSLNNTYWYAANWRHTP
jgi:hypothetical protein